MEILLLFWVVEEMLASRVLRGVVDDTGLFKMPNFTAASWMQTVLVNFID
jgi:hypothetical protein